MPQSHYPVDAVGALIRDTLAAAGFHPATAAEAAQHLVEAELRGVGSHGVNRLPWYLGRQAIGELQAAARPRVVQDQGSLLLVDGGAGLGIPAMNLAVEALVPRAREQGLAAAAIVRVGHTGRIGAYVEAAAAAGHFALCLGGGGHAKWSAVVPYGGAEPVMSTNPYAFALPGDGAGPLAVDFATAASANGKVALAAREGRQLPPGTIIDREGRPSTDPADLAAGGALLTMGGPKGSGMGLVAELLGLLLGGIVEFNWLLIALDLARFGDPAEQRAIAERYLGLVRGTRAAPGHEAVKLPGQWELALAAQRRRDGLPLSDAVIAGLREAAGSQGIDAAAYLGAGPAG